MIIFVGLDDTDMPDTPGTNQLARALIELVKRSPIHLGHSADTVEAE